MNLAQMLEQSMREAQSNQQGSAPSLSVEAKVALTREVHDEYLRPDLAVEHANSELEVGDLVVQKDYLSIHVVPNSTSPGIIHEVFAPVRGHTMGERSMFYSMELYDCTVAVLHEGDSGASLVIVPANTRRLKKYEPAE